MVTETTFICGVDIDGVCANYTDGFREFLSQELSIPLSELPQPRVYAFEEDPAYPIFSREEYTRLHQKAVHSGIYERLQPIPGAAEALQLLSASGVYIRIVTHRFINKYDYGLVVSQTVRWLDDQDIPFRGLCFERYKADIGADLYLDDSPANIQELRQSGKEAAIFTASYNQNVPGLRVDNWQEAVNLILDRRTGHQTPL